MAHNGLNTISEPIFAHSPPQMDPLNRVPPHARALPDWETDVGSSRNSVPQRGAAEERLTDETPVDELIRELEQDLEENLIAGGLIDGTARSDQSTSCGISEHDYATVGVRNLEWRLPIIRSAAHRSADAIASSQLVEPSETQEQQLTKIVLSTYRLIDPRFRGSYFQQVRVGRTLPMVLQNASCVDGTPLSLQPTLGNDPNNSVRLFGHSIALTETAPSVAIHRLAGSDGGAHRRTFRPITTQPSRKRNHNVSTRSKFRTEAIEVLAELQSRSHPAEWTLWLQGTRLIATLTVIACILVAIIAAYRTSLPLRTPVAPMQHVTERSRDNMPSQPIRINGKPATPRPEVLSPQAPPSVPSPDQVPVVSPVRSSPDKSLSRSPVADASSNEIDKIQPVKIAGSTDPELTQADLLAALARVRGASDADLPDMNSLVPLPQPLPNIPSPSSKSDAADSPSPSTPSSDLMLSVPDKPNLPGSANVVPPDDAVVALAVSTLWLETDSAAQRFTDSSAAELIEAWELIADLTAEGSAENLAAKRLVQQASWLIHPLAKIVAQLRSDEPNVAPRLVKSTEIEQQNTSNLNTDEVQKLYISWQGARNRVLRTSDLNQMLRQANVLLDRIIISDQLSPSDRSNFLAIIRNDVEKLARISSDPAATADTASLQTAIATLPAASEWDRLASAEHPSGMMASIYCLHQRRWDQGIAWLGQAGIPAVAAVAKAEWKLIQAEELDALDSTDAAARATLANRWSKIADRLEPREAAAVRLHAIELYGNQPDTESEQNLLRAQLPLYLQ